MHLSMCKFITNAITMKSPNMLTLSSLIALTLLFVTHLNPQLIESKTVDSDIEVLQSFRQSIDPNTISPASYLRTWDFDVDPCDNPGAHFLGIICSIPEQEEINVTNRVTGINLEGEDLEGFLTPAIGNLTELTFLNLRQNKFRGPIPDTITNIKKITRLLLSDNFLSGSIPSGISGLKLLQILDMSRNRLSGSIPDSITSLRSLTNLNLASNEFTGKIPELIALWQLNSLDLSSNQLSGSLPHFPDRLTSLSTAHNLLSGHISHVDRLKRLTTLDLSDNRFSGQVTREVITLPELIHLNISSNAFLDIEVVRMGSSRPASKLRSLEAQNNQIRGHLPLSLITYQNLRDVNLGHNEFIGEIPVEYGEKVSRGQWRSLFLDFNLLEGDVPLGFAYSSRNVRGSFAHNCVTNCRTSNMPMCRGGQRPPSECVGH